MSASKGSRSKFTLRLPPYLAARVRHIARRQGVSVNDWIVSQLERQSVASTSTTDAKKE